MRRRRSYAPTVTWVMPPRPAFLQRSRLTLQVRAYRCTCPVITMSTSCLRNKSSKISCTGHPQLVQSQKRDFGWLIPVTRRELTSMLSH